MVLLVFENIENYKIIQIAIVVTLCAAKAQDNNV